MTPRSKKEKEEKTSVVDTALGFGLPWKWIKENILNIEEKLSVHEEVCPCYLHENERRNASKKD